MKKLLPVLLIAVFCASCAFNPKYFTPAWPKPHAASRPKINGYGPVKFGMKRGEASQAIGETGQEMNYDEKEKPAYFFKDYQGSHEFDVWVYFDKKTDTVNKIELTSVNALNTAKNGADCLYYFRRFEDVFIQTYGDVDQPVRFHDDGGEHRATAFFTFSDSSSVRVTYKFDTPDRQCQINISYVTGWAT